MDWTPETNRVPTCLLTADEFAALKAAKHVEYWANMDQEWRYSPEPAFQRETIYRAKPAPAPTLSITVNCVTNVVVAGVTEVLRDGDRYWYAATHYKDWMWDAFWGVNRIADAHRLSRGLVHLTEAAARAHSMAMVGLKAEGV